MITFLFYTPMTQKIGKICIAMMGLITFLSNNKNNAVCLFMKLESQNPINK